MIESYPVAGIDVQCDSAEADDREFGRSLRAHFREAERRLHRQRVTICGSVIAILLVLNAAQLWLYIEAMKILCGGGR